MLQCTAIHRGAVGAGASHNATRMTLVPAVGVGGARPKGVVGGGIQRMLSAATHSRPLRMAPCKGFNIGSLLGPDQTDSASWWKVDKELWVEVSSMEDFEREVVNASPDKLIAIDWYATWCKGCKKTYPELCKVARQEDLQKAFKFVKICVDNMSTLARKSGITALPRMSVYAPGEGFILTVDATYSKSKNIPYALRVIMNNPGKSFVLDPNGIPMAVAKKEATKVVEEMKEAVAAVEQSKGSLHDHLMSIANGAKKTEGNGSGSGGGSSTTAESSLPPKVSSDSNWPASLGLGYHYIQDKHKFLMRFRNEYGYNGLIDKMYPTEVAVRMQPKEHYMDYTGSGVYCQSQLRAVFEDLQSHMFGNPHSSNPSSSLTSDRIEDARLEILRFFNADPAEYQVVFTRSATGALKMVGETYPWDKDSKFRYLRENHNSVLGMREYTLAHGGSFEAVDEDFVESWLSPDADSKYEHKPQSTRSPEDPAYSLFCYPAEDNFAGVKYPLEWISKIQSKSTPEHRWMVMLDAAAFAPTQPLDLSKSPADFVDIAFYKMFGYPTGLGALLVRVEAVPVLRKVFWGGGTVALATSGENFHVLKCRPSDKLEDGTVAFLDILSLTHGFSIIKKLGGMTRVQSHVGALTRWTYEALMKLKHPNGKPMIELFGKHHLPNSDEVQGGIFNFELLTQKGRVYSYKAFEREAAEAGFHVRTGAACNPGACYKHLGVEESDVEGLAGIKEGCEDDVEFVKVQRPPNALQVVQSVDLIEQISNSAITVGHPAEVAMKWVHVPLGSIRVSFGYMSTFEDAWAFVDFVEKKYSGLQ